MFLQGMNESAPRREAMNFSRYLRRHVLGSLSAPLVWAWMKWIASLACESA